MRAVSGRGALALRFILLLAVAGLLASSLALYRELSSARKPGSGSVTVTVEKGSTLYELSVRLEREGVVDSAALLRLASQQRGLDRSLQPGTYTFRRGSTIDEVIAVLEKGPPVEGVTVTIPEGFTVKQIAERLARAGVVDRGAFIEMASTGAGAFASEFPFLASNRTGSLEGYLFPETYRFRRGESPKRVITVMLRQFEKELARLDLADRAAAGFSLHEVVTVASLVEREAKVADERPKVASVIYNRLAKKMKLQLCATVQYALGENKPRLTYDDLAIDSPYNTYRVDGLPPGPICNPGFASLEAAAHPASTRYLYYVLSTEKGHHVFAETYGEFLRAKARYKRYSQSP